MHIKRIYFTTIFQVLLIIAYATSTQDSLQNLLKESSGKTKAKLQLELAESYLDSEPAKAFELAEEAVSLSIRSVDADLQTRAIIFSANALLMQQKYADAEVSLNSAIKLAKDTKNDSLHALAINDKGKLFLKKGDLDKAIDLFQESLEIRVSLDDLPNQVLSKINIGVAYRSKQVFDTALVFFNQAYEQAAQNGDLKKEASALHHTGGTYWAMKNIDSASAVYKRALELRKKIRDKHGQAQTLNSLGIMFRDMSEYETALEYHLKSLELKKEFGTQQEIAYTLNSIGSVYLKLNQWEEALKYYENALAIRMELGNLTDQAASLDNIGHLYKNRQRFNEALNYYKKALSLRKQIDNKSLIALSLNNIGSSHLKMNDYDAALEYYYEALKIAEISALPEEIGRSYKNIGLIYKDLNATDEALENFLMAVNYFTKSGNRNSEAHLYNLIGGLYWNNRDFGKALDNYNKALSIREQINDKQNIAATNRNIGILFKDAGKYGQALEYYDKALKTYEQINSNIDKAWLLNNYGNLFKDKKQLSKALQYYNQSLQLFKAADHADGISNVDKNIGESFLLLGNANQAFPYLEESVDIAKKTDQIELLQDCSKFYAEALYTKGMHKKAYEYFKLYADLRDSVMNEETLKKFAEIQIKNKLEFKQKEFEQYKSAQQAELLQTRLHKTYWIALASILFIVMLFFVFRTSYRSKMNSRLLIKNNELEETNKRLQISESDLKLANSSKNKLISIIAHDLKNPISTSLGLSELLHTRFDTYDESKIKRFIEQLYLTADSTSMLLENLLEWSRSQSSNVKPNFEECNISELVETTFQLVSGMANKHKITLRNIIPADFEITADKNMLLTVFRNLITNAVKFSEANGTVEVSCKEDMGETVFVITDSGIGMTAQQAAHIFDSNTDVKSIGSSENKGTGLGLQLCKEFVQKHGGAISAESEPGKGSVFQFSIKKR